MLALLKRFARDKAALLGLCLLALLVIAAIFAPWLAPYPNDVTDFHIERRLQAPAATALFGTDRMGSDIFSRQLFGARIT